MPTGPTTPGTFNGSGHSPSSERQVLRVLVPLLDSLIFVTGLTGNVLVQRVLIGRKKQQRRNGTNILLLNLSVADLLQLLCVPFHATSIALARWVFGDFLCKAVSFMGVACSSASVFTLAALAINRYITLLHPSKAFRFQLTWYFCTVMLLIWVPSLAVASPQFAFRGTRVTDSVYCYAFMTDASQVFYASTLFVLGFAVPLTTIVIMYSRIYCFLRSKRASVQSRLTDRYHTQVTRISILLVLVFTLCWLPSYVLLLLLVQGSAPHGAAFPVSAQLLAFSSTIANPVLYVFISEKFRQDLQRLALPGCCRAGGVMQATFSCGVLQWAISVRIGSLPVNEDH
uniref:G-protein coupled receptors family 1 profile domain-containing protein n=1 Tax=Erpetoichthys calabaricus TaxID=27687 RepID=A0A8C4SJU8_ERPCA